VRLVKKHSELVPSAKDVARALQSALMDADRRTVRVDEVGEQSEDGECLYAIGTTPDGVRMSFLVRVGGVERYDG
jgi:hypothetical protein